jgi:hypothetical protein
MITNNFTGRVWNNMGVFFVNMNILEYWIDHWIRVTGVKLGNKGASTLFILSSYRQVEFVFGEGWMGTKADHVTVLNRET